VIMLRPLAAALLMMLAYGCTRSAAPPNQAAAPPVAAAPAARVTFVNRTWVVGDSSSVQPGGVYTFLADGTLVLTSPHGTPALGAWKRDASGLTMIEEGRPYGVDILRLDADAFWIRMHNPGPPVTLRLAAADTTWPPTPLARTKP
jgi:hypothetical protein